jgi:hypothetical protein
MFSGWILIGFFWFTILTILATLGFLIGFGIGRLMRGKVE